MGRKNVIKHFNMLDNVSIASSQTSEHTFVESVDQASILIDWSAGSTPIGVITVESSNSTDSEFKSNTETWNEIDFGASIDISGATGYHQLIFTALPFRAIRIKYTRSSGSALLTATIHAESLGA